MTKHRHAPGSGAPSSPVYLNSRLSTTIAGAEPLADASGALAVSAAPSPLAAALRSFQCVACSFCLSSMARVALSAPRREKSDPLDGRAWFLCVTRPLPSGLDAVTGTGILAGGQG